MTDDDWKPDRDGAALVEAEAQHAEGIAEAQRMVAAAEADVRVVLGAAPGR